MIRALPVMIIRSPHAFIISSHATIVGNYKEKTVTCWDSDSAWAKMVIGGKSWESGILLRELIRSLSFCTA